MTSLTSASGLDPASLANLHSELEAGRNPLWPLVDDSSQADPPRTANDGLSLVSARDGAAILALFNVGVRRVAAYRTVIAQITAVNSVDYDITITSKSGTATVSYTSDGSATRQEIAEGLAAAINGDATIGSDFDALGEADPSTGNYRLRIRGAVMDGYTIDGWSVNSVSQSTDLVFTGDPNYCRAAYWGLPGGDASVEGLQTYIPYDSSDSTEEVSSWRLLTPVDEPAIVPSLSPQGSIYVPFGGHMDRLDVRGLSRVKVQIVEYHGPGDHGDLTLWKPRVLLGPCRRESARPLGSGS